MRILILTNAKFQTGLITSVRSHLEKCGDSVEISDQKNFANYNYDLGISIHYKHILSPSQINSFKYGVINIHPSLLPYGRGADPTIWAVLKNEPAGITIHWIDEGIDTGKILFQFSTKVRENETGENLYERLLSHYCYTFYAFWDDFSYNLKNGIVPSGREQIGTGSAHKRKDLKKLGWVDISKREVLALSNSKYYNFWLDDNGERVPLSIKIGDK